MALLVFLISHLGSASPRLAHSDLFDDDEDE
jgi:hypothetical protein